MVADRLASLLAFREEDPEDAFVRFALAREYEKRGDAKAARTTFEALVADRPDYVGTYYHLGKLYQRLGLSQEAMQTWRAGIEQASQQGDRHSESELRGALMELEIDDL
jgi:Tfp pilus assembly protein PilF